jgi:hypothetical protein
MLIAPLRAGSEPALRALLASMNTEPGLADPHNAVLPFGTFRQLHFARMVLLDDALQVDLETVGLPRPALPTYLAFMGDCDGPAPDFLRDLAQRAQAGLRSIFSHCQGFPAGDGLLDWMLAHVQPAAASYVHWVGRTVQAVEQEHALQRSLSARVPRQPLASGAEARQLHAELQAYAKAEIQAGRLSLTPPTATPLAWLIHHYAHALLIPLAGLVLLPAVVLLLPLLIYQLRSRETRDAEICPRPQARALLELQELEDRVLTNQYTAIGAVKPGLFRRWLVSAILVAIDYACRHVFTQGHLGRVQTIHFAHWAFLDNKTRVVFTSNYDGSHQGYMDDFINKVAWGLNLVFSNGLGWPRTRWLILGGARLEQRFKHFQRRHQVPTQVWFKAYPHLTLADIRRNQGIRDGLERQTMTDAEATNWLKLL